MAEQKSALETGIVAALRRPRTTKNLFDSRAEMVHGIRPTPAETRMAPGLRYAGLGARSAIHLLHPTLAARRGRSASAANMDSVCSLCRFRTGDNAEHIVLHCVHPLAVELRVTLDARDLLLVMSGFAFDLCRTTRCTRPKREWVLRVAGVVDDLSRLHSAAFRGKIDSLERPVADAALQRRNLEAMLETYVTAVACCSRNAMTRLPLLGERVERLGQWVGAVRDLIATGESPHLDRLGQFELHSIPRTEQTMTRIQFDVGVDPTEILARKRNPKRKR